MRARSRSRLTTLTIISGLSGVCACGLVFSPGDYSESAPTSPNNTTDSAAGDTTSSAIDTGSNANETGPTDAGAGVTRVLLVGGRRSAINGESTSQGYFIAETLKTSILPNGDVVTPWVFDYAPPVTTSWNRAQILGGALFIQTGTTAYTAPIGDHINGDWTTLALRGSSPENSMRAWMFEKGLLAAGGFNGSTASTNVFFAPFNLGDGGIDNWQNLSTAGTPASKLVKSRADSTLVRTQKFIYVLGGRDSISSTAAGRSEVDVAPLDSTTGLPGEWAATSPLTNPNADGGSITFASPNTTAGGGYLFVVGGTMNNQGSPTDIAIAAKIDDTTGKLGPWLALPKLPLPTASIALLFANDHLYAFGGLTSGTEMTDDVLSLNVANGTLGTEWKMASKLPSKRSSMTAVGY